MSKFHYKSTNSKICWKKGFLLILIDIDIFKNDLIDIDSDIFKNALIDLAFDIFRSGPIDIDIFQKCQYIDNWYGSSIYWTPVSVN